MTGDSPEFAGGVLCGGLSRRMGRDKANIVVGGSALATRVAYALQTAGAEPVAAIGGNPPAGLTRIEDAYPGEGPVGGVITAVTWSPVDAVVVMACDLVAPDPQAVELLLAAPRAAVRVPVHEGRRQWGHALWLRSALTELTRAFEGGARSFRAATADVEVATVPGLPAKALRDADTPEALKTLGALETPDRAAGQ